MAGLDNWITVNTKNQVFILDFSNFILMDKRSAVDHTVSNIIKRYDNLYLSLSGGLDSEFAAQSLYERGIKFTPVIVDFELNCAETWNAYYWCYEHKIIPDIIKISMNEIVEKFSEISLNKNVPFVSSIDFIVEQYVSERDGHLIHSCAEPFNRKSVFTDKLNTTVAHKLEFCSFDFAIDEVFPEKHPCGFLTYTPELLFSLINEFDYSKPAQVSMSEFYGIRPRPKLHFLFNVGLHPHILHEALRINTMIRIDSIILGDKTEFLEKASQKQKINCSYAPYEGRN